MESKNFKRDLWVSLIPLACGITAAFLLAGCGSSNNTGATGGGVATSSSSTICTYGIAANGACNAGPTNGIYTGVCTANCITNCSSNGGTLVTNAANIQLCQMTADVLPVALRSVPFTGGSLDYNLDIPRINASNGNTNSGAMTGINLFAGDTILFNGSGSYGTTPNNCNTSFTGTGGGLNGTIEYGALTAKIGSSEIIDLSQQASSSAYTVKSGGTLVVGFNWNQTGDTIGCFSAYDFVLAINYCVDNNGLAWSCK